MKRWLPALLVAGLLLPAAPGLGQEEEDLTEDLRALRSAYDRARERIEDLDFAGAVKELGTVIEPRRVAKAGDLSLEELRLLCSARDLRARAYFNLGNVKAAESDFEALIRLNPAYAIDRQNLSPKVVDLFDKVRARIAGILYLQVDPPKARVSLDGDALEGVPADGIAVLAGNRTLAIEMEGFDPHRETMLVIAGAPMRKTIRLRANRRAIELITAPDGVAVSLDGVAAGTTRGPATPDVLALASQYGFDPRTASAPLLLPLVTPGDHRVAFERECYQSTALTLKVALDPEKNAPLRFAPVVLKESKTDLKVTSSPPGADVFVDGERKGTTPVTIASVCGGERDVVVSKPGAGSWNERIRMTPGQVNSLDVRLRPTLLYAGTFRLDEWGRAVWSDEDKAFVDEISKGLKTLNLVRDAAILQEVRNAVIAWMISAPNDVRAGTLLPPAILAQAAQQGGADLVLAGLTLHNDPEKTWTMALYSVLHQTPDVALLRIDKPEGARDFARRLDRVPPETELWWGMGLADTVMDPSGSAALVARVLPGSPAAKGGLRVGDRVRAVGNRKTQTVREVEQAIAAEASRPGGVRSAVVLAVDDAEAQRAVRLAPGESPVVIPLRDPALLYNRALAEFRLRSRAALDDGDRGVALLNLGIAYMHFRAYDKAQTEGFARAVLPKGTGISEGTLQYYRGLCALRRGDPSAALQAFEQAAAQAGSTLDSGDGPSAAAAAARMLQTLSQAP